MLLDFPVESKVCADLMRGAFLLSKWRKLPVFSLEGWTDGVRWMSGRGRVCWRREGKYLHLEERGDCWMDGPQAKDSAFWNVWVFNFGAGSTLGLGHARQGQPKVLVELVWQKVGQWRSKEDHLCGKDVYHCQVEELPGEIVLSWRVRGPEKNQLLIRRYRLGEGEVI